MESQIMESIILLIMADFLIMGEYSKDILQYSATQIDFILVNIFNMES